MTDEPPAPGRRDYDEHGAVVVSLREHLETQIQSLGRELGQRIQADHAAMTLALHELQRTIETADARHAARWEAADARHEALVSRVVVLEQHDSAQRVTFATIAKIAAATTTVLLLLTAVVGLVFQATLN